MARPFPYTFISCPCAETSTTPAPSTNRISKDFSKVSLADQQRIEEEEEEDEEKTFDPRSPRANYSLYPPEHLLYCEDCQQIKCPRCITEEIVCWYCPNCLFETPSSMVKSEGNRYDRTAIDVYVNRGNKKLIRTLDAREIVSVVPYAPRLLQLQHLETERMVEHRMALGYWLVAIACGRLWISV